jgi:hypothetical protein
MNDKQTNKQTNNQTNFIEQNPSWEANRSSGSQEISRILCTPEVHSRIDSSHRRSVPWATSFQSCPNFPARTCGLMLLSRLPLGLPSCFFPQIFPPKPCKHRSSPPCVLHALPSSVFLVWSPEYSLMSSTDHKASLHVVLSTPLLPRPSYGTNSRRNDCNNFTNTCTIHLFIIYKSLHVSTTNKTTHTQDYIYK